MRLREDQYQGYEVEITHQSNEDEEDLDDVCVGDRYESSEERVEDGDDGRHDDGDLDVELEDHLQSRACGRRGAD